MATQIKNDMKADRQQQQIMIQQNHFPFISSDHNDSHEWNQIEIIFTINIYES